MHWPLPVCIGLIYGPHAGWATYLALLLVVVPLVLALDWLSVFGCRHASATSAAMWALGLLPTALLTVMLVIGKGGAVSGGSLPWGWRAPGMRQGPNHLWQGRPSSTGRAPA